MGSFYNICVFLPISAAVSLFSPYRYPTGCLGEKETVAREDTVGGDPSLPGD